MAYPEKVTDLTPDQLVFIDSEADKVLKIAPDDWVRLSENYARALEDPSQFTPLAISEINGWAIRENRTPIASTGSGF